MRKYKGAEKDPYAWIQQNVLLIPFINKLRLKYDKYESSSGVLVQEHLRVINYCDGDNSQLDTVSVEGIWAHAQTKITANKHNAARTGVEQAKNLDKQFIIGKRLNKTTTVEHIPSSKYLLKQRIEQKFQEFYGRSRLKK
jgi:hypothetical protein